MKFCLLLLLICFGKFSKAQAQNIQPCSSPKASQFDFWIGEWNLTWNDSLHGTNKIEKLYGNCTVHENFTDPQNNFLGQSWSVYNLGLDQWQQTWIDNNGGYIALTGGMVNDSMILETAERTVPANLSPSRKMKNRMVFFNINPGSFDWDWQASTDGGATWSSQWKIHYMRKKP